VTFSQFSCGDSLSRREIMVQFPSLLTGADDLLYTESFKRDD